MRIEIILFLITVAVIYNIYTDGKFLKMLYTWKKYYQMAGVVVGALFLYYVFKKNPLQARDMIAASGDYMKYMPLDRNTSSILSPIMDFTRNQIGGRGAYGRDASTPYGGGSYGRDASTPYGGGSYGRDASTPFPYLNLGGMGAAVAPRGESRILRSGGGTTEGGTKATKRSVSETKKKFVAAQQNWHCGKCQKQLPAWFEVDHKVRLEYGGSNHIDNLVALCRDCHGEKTAIENL
jgi:hypothetical protein